MAGRPREQTRSRTSLLSLLRHRSRQPRNARRAAGQECSRTMPLSPFRNSSLQPRKASGAAGLGRPRTRLQSVRRRAPRWPKEASAPAARSPQQRPKRLRMQVPKPRSGSCALLSRSEQLQSFACLPRTGLHIIIPSPVLFSAAPGCISKASPAGCRLAQHEPGLPLGVPLGRSITLYVDTLCT